jgi:hypothetical protein
MNFIPFFCAGVAVFLPLFALVDWLLGKDETPFDGRR